MKKSKTRKRRNQVKAKSKPKKRAKPRTKKVEKSARKRSRSFKTGGEYKTIDTRSGETFEIYTFFKRIPRSQSLNLDNLRKYFENQIVPEFHAVWLRHRKLGRRQFIFRVKTQLFIFKQKVKEFFSSFRSDVISEDEFDSEMIRLIAEFEIFLSNYISKGALKSLTVSGISVEVSIPKVVEKKRARVAKKTKRKKKNTKKVGGRGHRKR